MSRLGKDVTGGLRDATGRESFRSNPASDIACIYRERWQIEPFFKALKQNLKEKPFVGTSQNALRIQIRTAVFSLSKDKDSSIVLPLERKRHLEKTRRSEGQVAGSYSSV